MDDLVEREDDLRECRRNVYRLQTSGERLCEALRKIADGCADPGKVAKAALHHKEPDPDWSAIITTRSGDKEREALVKCRDKFAEYVEIHRDKLPADPNEPPPANWREIAAKVQRNQEMVDLCDAALSHGEER